MTKILTDDIETISIISPEKDAVLKLREIVRGLDKSEVTALATMLSHSYSISLGRWVTIAASCEFGQDLTTAVLQVPALSPTSKLAMAIELLELCREDDQVQGESVGESSVKYDGDVDVDSLPNRFHMGL